MLTLNDRINNRHKIVQNHREGTIEGFSQYLKNRALFLYGDSQVDYYYINGYIASININKAEWGLSIVFNNKNVENAFNTIKYKFSANKFK